MSAYIPNPKLAGSGILAAIPQKGRCPIGCADCFFQSGRSYLEPLLDHTPNMPPDSMADSCALVRVNDGNDSGNGAEKVLRDTFRFARKFFNTSMKSAVARLAPHPVVLTLNPAGMTDSRIHVLDVVPPHLMFFRFRVNTWNLDLLDLAIERLIDERDEKERRPIVLTWMAYHSGDDIPPGPFRADYVERRRTLNTYWAITSAAWKRIMDDFRFSRWVYSCGKSEGEQGVTACRFCGNCLREWAATMERIGGGRA